MHGFLLHLAGPMQSWADTGFGQLRGAGAFPSRAGVLGIVAAAQGIPRADPRLVALHDAFRVHVATARAGAVRRDFHTVETVEGKARTLTQREYHHDAHFIALVVSDDSEAFERAVDALWDPVFPSFLGRRSCPPSVPLAPAPVEVEPFAALIAAARAARQVVPTTDEGRPPSRSGGAVPVYLDGHFDAVPSALGGADPTYGTRRDWLVAPRRAYADRPFTRVLVPPLNVPQ